MTHYVAMAGIGRDAASRPAGAPGNGFMGYDRLTTMAMIKDGSSNTIALMETRVNVGPWARGGASTVRGYEPADEPPQLFGEHAGGLNVGMGDGSVRFLHFPLKSKQLAAAITIAGDEPINLD